MAEEGKGDLCQINLIKDWKGKLCGRFCNVQTSFLNGSFLASFCLFLVVSNKHYNFFNKYMGKNVHAVVRSNSQPSDYDSPPLTTRLGLPPSFVHLNFVAFSNFNSKHVGIAVSSFNHWVGLFMFNFIRS